MKCIKEGCDTVAWRADGLCMKHYQQAWYLKKVGREALLERPSKEKWTNVQTGYVMVKQGGKLTYEHIVLAEKALGHPPPEGAIVHHRRKRDDNHGYRKLVICPNQAYHILLHNRMRELGYEAD